MNDRRRAGAVLALFILTLFTGSALLFFVQPMFAKMVLPLLGGTPAVWATSMVFFQAALLAGYAYAHWSVARLGIRRQALVQVPLVLAPILLLPIAVPQGWTPPPEGRPALWLLALLMVALGLPFFVLSTSAPLLQRWFASTGHPSGRDPYFLYAASNAGSMLALLAYPFAVEPALPLAVQSRLWAVGYGLLAAGTVACALLVRRRANDDPGSSAHAVASDGEAAEPIPPNQGGAKPVDSMRRLRWVALAFVPSMFMLAVTTYISTDIAAIPLLWVVPLTIYLFTFIVAFSTRSIPLRWAARVEAIVLVTLALVLLVGARGLPRTLVLGLPLVGLFVCALVCHAQLANDRPPASHLTEFYLWVALGGVLGGIVAGLVAPAAFDSLVEYPVAIVLACLLMPPLARRRLSARNEQFLLMVLPAVGILTTVLLIVTLERTLPRIGRLVAITIALALSALLVARPLRFGLALAAVMIGATVAGADQSSLLYSERTFFGVQRVLGDSTGRFHRLLHGTTVHGIQSLDPELSTEPLSYYHREGPIGQAMTTLPAARAPQIGVVGLGTGSLACYAHPGQRWTFFEIDPEMEEIARNPRLFTFLSDCPGEHEVVLGDARLSLDDTADGTFGVLVVDAFNSDAIPVHLLTREAIQLYMSKLAPGGVVAVHISNRYLNLSPVLANLASDLRLPSLLGSSRQTLEDLRQGKSASDWVLLARSEADFALLGEDVRWSRMEPQPGARVWTDDFSDVFSVFRWRTG